MPQKKALRRDDWPRPGAATPLAPSSTPSAALRVLRGEDRGKLYPFHPGKGFTIGRDEEADLPLYDALVESVHCRVEANPDDESLLLLTDLSRNNRALRVNDTAVYA